MTQLVMTAANWFTFAWLATYLKNFKAASRGDKKWTHSPYGWL